MTAGIARGQIDALRAAGELSGLRRHRRHLSRLRRHRRHLK